MQITQIETNRIAAVATKAQSELDIAKSEAEKPSCAVTEVQRRLDRLEDLGSAGGNWPLPESGSDDSQ